MSQETTAMMPGDEAAEIAALWCIRLSEGELSEAEWAEFDAWLEEPGNAELFQEATGVWQASGAVGDWPRVIALRTEALTQFRKASQRRWLTASPGWLARRVGYAAVLVLTLSATLYWYAMRPSSFETEIGERQVAVLTDGSRVSLDAVTEIEVTMKDAARQVELVEGRAKFDVAKDPLRPFTVTAGDKLVVAVGTSFSVELIDEEVRVILYEGQVEVRDRLDTAQVEGAEERRYLLKPGAQLVDTIGTDKPVRISRLDLSQSLSWEQGLINFNSEPLASAVERMNRYSAQQIRLGDPSLGSIPVSGLFRGGDLDAFVEGVTMLHPIRRRTVDGVIVLEAK